MIIGEHGEPSSTLAPVQMSETEICTANQPHQNVVVISLLDAFTRAFPRIPPKKASLVGRSLKTSCKLRNLFTLCPDMVTGYIHEMLSRRATPASICYRASILGFTWRVRWETEPKVFQDFWFSIDLLPPHKDAGKPNLTILSSVLFVWYIQATGSCVGQRIQSN